MRSGVEVLRLVGNFMSLTGYVVIRQVMTEFVQRGPTDSLVHLYSCGRVYGRMLTLLFLWPVAWCR